MKKVVILSNESGSGHKQTAKVLSQALQQAGFNVKTVSVFQELLLDLDVAAKWLGMSGEAIYNKALLKHEAPRAFYNAFFLAVYYFFVLPNSKTVTKRFTAFFAQEQPDLVISVISILNNEIAASLQATIPFLIIQTDLFDHEQKSRFRRWLVPRSSWFVADAHTYMAAGTAKGYQQALALSQKTDRVMQLSGNVIDPRFLQPTPLNISTERQTLGLHPDKPVGLFLYGGYPPKRLFKLAQQLDALDLTVQFIFICGKNTELKNRLNGLSTRYEKCVLGYSRDVPYYMRLADFLIGKPGPGVIMESIAVNLPLLLDVSHVLPHEVDNVAWVVQQGFGLRFKHSQALHADIQQLITSGGCQQMRENMQRYENKAVFEVVAWVEQQLG